MRYEIIQRFAYDNGYSDATLLGWYWRPYSAASDVGLMPFGPFKTEAEAIADAEVKTLIDPPLKKG
jgi:hypothetical protein